MSKRSLAAVIGVAAVASAGLAAFLVLRGSSQGGSVAERSGRALAAALTGTLEEAVLGVVADARGSSTEIAVAQLARIRRRLEEAGVQVLLSLGGLGTSREEIANALRPLAVGARWPVIAIPGDREDLPAHRAAIAAVNQEEQTLVLDGSAIRLLIAETAVIGTLPGSASGKRLLAGVEGCQHTAADARALAEVLLEQDVARVWASHAPPRQQGPTASDVALGGAHVGEAELAEAIGTSKVSLVLHALVDEAAARQRPGSLRLPSAHPAHLASGALDAVPTHVPDHGTITGAALVIRFTARELRWRPLLLEGERLRYPLR